VQVVALLNSFQGNTLVLPYKIALEEKEENKMGVFKSEKALTA
jgi:hypothetical protein